MYVDLSFGSIYFKQGSMDSVMVQCLVLYHSTTNNNYAWYIIFTPDFDEHGSIFKH